MVSPLAWVTNTGFIVFGLVILAGVTALRGLTGWRRWAVLLPAALLAVGGVLLGLFPGSGEALEEASGDFHSMGAFAGFIGGNVLAIQLGGARRRLGLVERGATHPFLIGLLCAGASIARGRSDR